MVYVWLAVLIIAIIAELATTTALVSIWFIPSAIISLVLAYFKVSIWIQIAVFTAISVFALSQTKRIEALLKRKPILETNIDAIIGKEAILKTAITKTSAGTLIIKGVTWNVKTNDNVEVEKDSVVKILAIKGNTLIVEKKGVDL